MIAAQKRDLKSSRAEEKDLNVRRPRFLQASQENTLEILIASSTNNSWKTEYQPIDCSLYPR